MAMGPLGFVAVLAGWTTTEVGRQPWTVYGMLRTADSMSPSLVGGDVLVSLLAYMVVYLIIYPSAVLIAARLVRKGPALAPETVAPIESGRPSAPINVELVQEGKTL
jgi:cytochrome d ubiquinol oxidase subunit I